MGAGIEIDIAANARDFQRGTKDVEAALDGVADSLDELTAESARAADQLGGDLGDGAEKGAREADRAVDKLSDSLKDVTRDAKRAGDKLGDEIGDGAKDASRATDKLEDSFKDVADASKRESAKASSAMATEFDKGTDAAKRDLEELKDEAISNASETLSSFDGSLEGLVDGIQGTLGGVISNIGPLGMVAGAALAVGVGLGVAKGQELEEAMMEARERASELAAEISEADGDISKIEWGKKFEDWGLELDDSRSAMTLWTGDVKANFDRAKEYVAKFGLNLNDVSRGLAGIDADAATRSIQQLTDQMDKLKRQRQLADGGEERERLSGEIRIRQDLVDKLREQGGATEDAIRLQKEMAEVNAAQQAQDEANARAVEARTDAINSLQSALDDGVSSYAEFQDAETGALDPSGYINAMAERAAATTNFNKNVQSIAAQFNLTQEETQAILDQGIDFAPMLQSIIDSGLSEKFTTQIKSAVGGGQEILDGTPLGATVKADADTGTAEAKLATTAKAGRTATVKADADTRGADRSLGNVADKKRTAKITAKADTGAADKALANVARARTAQIRASASTYGAESQLDSLTRTRYMTIIADVQERRGRSIR